MHAAEHALASSFRGSKLSKVHFMSHKKLDPWSYGERQVVSNEFSVFLRSVKSSTVFKRTRSLDLVLFVVVIRFRVIRVIGVEQQCTAGPVQKHGAGSKIHVFISEKYKPNNSCNNAPPPFFFEKYGCLMV